jgi:hypothetical protein
MWALLSNADINGCVILCVCVCVLGVGFTCESGCVFFL